MTLVDERAGIETAVSLPGSTDSDTLLIPGLRENTNYSATVSAHNHFQFSIDSPVQSHLVSFGESASEQGVVGVSQLVSRVWWMWS